MLAEGRPAQPTASWGPWVAVAGSSGQGDLPSALHYHWGPPKSAPSRQPSPSAWRKRKGRGQEGEPREGGARQGGGKQPGIYEGRRTAWSRAGAPAQTCLEMHPHPPSPGARLLCRETGRREAGQADLCLADLGWGWGELLLGEGDAEPLPPVGTKQASCFSASPLPPCPLPIRGGGGGLVT